MNQIITLPYGPRVFANGEKSTWDIHDHPAKFKVLVAHRRFGKSVFIFNHIQREALRKKGRYAIVGPTYKQIKSIYWKGGIVQKYLPNNAIVEEGFSKLNKSELYIEYANGSILEFIGSDDYDSHRGAQYDYLAFDEFDEQKIEGWNTVFKYTLVAQADGSFGGGGALFAGTLKGRGNLWNFYQRGMVDDPEWQSWMLKASETLLLSQKDIDEIRRECGDNDAVVRQELECEPMYYSGLIYPEFTQANIVDPFLVPAEWKNVSVPGALDHGATNPTAVGRYAIDDDGNIFVIGEYYKPNEIIINNAAEIRRLFDLNETEYLNLIADPSVMAKTMQDGERRYSVADEYLKYKINLIPGNNDLLAGINRVKELLRFDPKHVHPITGRIGAPRLFFFKGRCPKHEEEFGKYIWEEPKEPGMNMSQKPVKAYDHAMDQMRYWIASRQVQVSIPNEAAPDIGNLAKKDREDAIRESYSWQQGENWKSF